MGALQSALEVALGLDERRAGAVATVVIHGSRLNRTAADALLTSKATDIDLRATISAPSSLSPSQSGAVSAGPCGHSHNHGDTACLSILIQAVVRLAWHGRSSSPNAEIDPSFLPAVARAFYSSTLYSPPTLAGTLQIPPTQSDISDPPAAIAAFVEHVMRSLSDTQFDVDFYRGLYPRDEASVFPFGGVLAYGEAAVGRIHPRRSRRR